MVVSFLFAGCEQEKEEGGTYGEQTSSQTTNATTPDKNETESGSVGLAHSVGLTYKVKEEGTTCTITGMGTCTDTAVVIPQKCEVYTVESIGGMVFSDQHAITSVMIPGTVKAIGSFAFANCSGLTSSQFQGTRAQWNDMQKGFGWDGQTGNYVVHCTDGEIAK